MEMNERPKLGSGEGGVNVWLWVLLALAMKDSWMGSPVTRRLFRALFQDQAEALPAASVESRQILA